VFINDEGRYALFEKAYPLVFDPANYFRLEKLFNSDEYMSRFRNPHQLVLMPRYFLEVMYKGTAYSGFQIQANAVTCSKCAGRCPQDIFT
jgi:hypothetical protein